MKTEMARQPDSRTPARRGFTMAEALIVALIGAMMMIGVNAFFQFGVKSTIKGQDNLESTRAASLLFSQFRKDLMSCQFIEVGAASITLEPDENSLPSAPPFGDSIKFGSRNATTTWSLSAMPDGKKFVKRFTVNASGETKSREFGVPRMKTFRILQIWKKQRILSFITKPSQVLVSIQIDSDDPRFPTKAVEMSSFFLSNQMSASDWNFIYYD